MRWHWLCVLGTLFCGASLPAQDTSAETPVLLEMLSHPAPGHRVRAAAGLEALGDAAVPALAAEVRSGTLTRALPAAVVLTRLESRAAGAVHELAPLLSSHCEDWRWNVALQVIGKVAPDSRQGLLPTILTGLKGGPLRQHAAVEALRGMGSEASQAGPALQELLHAARGTLQGVVLDRAVIDKRSVAWTSPTRAYDRLAIAEAWVAVGAAPEAVTPHLLAMTASGLPSLRWGAANLLLQHGTPDSHALAVATLASLLGDRRPGIREAAIQSLGDAGPAAAPAALNLAAMLTQSESALRRDAATALGQIGPAASSALPALKKAAQMQQLADPTSAKVYTDAISAIER